MAVATPCLKFSHSPTTPNDAVLLFRSTTLLRNTSCCSSSPKLNRTRSFDLFQSKHKTFPSSSLSSIRRVCSASFDNSSSSNNYDEIEEFEFSKKMEELALKFQNDEEDDVIERSKQDDEETIEAHQSSLMEFQSIEMKAKSLDLPLSLRMLKRKKKQWQEINNFIEVVGENAYCSVKKAFSSMVFIIRELHCYTLQMREILFYEDLQGILSRVQREMHASFVWLFQQVFSQTPILMVYVMILLANFTVHSISDSAAALAAVNPAVATVEEREIENISENESFNKFDAASTMKTFSVTTASGSKTTEIGGGNGGGNNVKPVGSGMDGDDNSAATAGVLHRPIVSQSDGAVKEDTWQKEKELWKEMVDEASRMKSEVRDEVLNDDEILKGLVSPVSVKIEGDVEYEDYFKTEMIYQNGLAKEPNNVLLLANYAQFLYLVLHDFDRAEDYFKRAVKVEPKDAEAHNKYANFLWHVRNDLWAAEETFLEAISADPSNSYYAANYAHFLWNTGGEDTCFPLDSPNDETLDADETN